uniref:hypothetical protein n=2 Tax=Enterobacteriaceae TaxID=543 RepID=UPI0013FD6A68
KMKFLVVPTGTDVSGNSLNLTDPDFSSVALFKGGITLQHGLVGLNLVKATSDIAAQGYHIVEISVNVEVL